MRKDLADNVFFLLSHFANAHSSVRFYFGLFSCCASWVSYFKGSAVSCLIFDGVRGSGVDKNVHGKIRGQKNLCILVLELSLKH